VHLARTLAQRPSPARSESSHAHLGAHRTRLLRSDGDFGHRCGHVFNSTRPSLSKTGVICHQPQTINVIGIREHDHRCCHRMLTGHSLGPQLCFSYGHTICKADRNIWWLQRQTLRSLLIALVMPTAALHIALGAPPPGPVLRDLLIEEVDCYLLPPQVGPQSYTLPQRTPRRTCPPSIHFTRNRPTTFGYLLL